MLNSRPGLYPLDASSAPIYLVVTQKHRGKIALGWELLQNNITTTDNKPANAQARGQVLHRVHYHLPEA